MNPLSSPHPVTEIEYVLYAAKGTNRLLPTFDAVHCFLQSDELYEDKVYLRIQKKCKQLFEAETEQDYSFKRFIKRCFALLFGNSTLAEYDSLQKAFQAKIAKAAGQNRAAFTAIEQLVEAHLQPYFDGSITKATECTTRAPLIEKLLPQLQQCALATNVVQQKILDSYFASAAAMLNRHFGRAKVMAEESARERAKKPAEQAAQKAAEKVFKNAKKNAPKSETEEAAKKAATQAHKEVIQKAVNRVQPRFGMSGGVFRLINPSKHVPEAATALSLFCTQLIHSVGIDFKNLMLSSNAIRRKAYETVQELYDDEQSVRLERACKRRRENFASGECA